MKLQVIDPFHQDGSLLVRGTVVDGDAAAAIAADPDKRARCVELPDDEAAIAGPERPDLLPAGALGAETAPSANASKTSRPAAATEAASSAAPEAAPAAKAPPADKE